MRRIGLSTIALWATTACGDAAEDATGTTAASTTGADTTDAVTTGPATTGSAATGSTDDGSIDGSTTGSIDTSTTEGSTGGDPTACTLAAIAGTCIDAAACLPDATPILGTCDGVPSLQCCLADATACSVAGARGLCLPTASCPADHELTAGVCPGPADVQCCTDPTTTCDPDAHPTPNEGLLEELLDPVCPAGMLPVDGFCIDRWEAALVAIDETGSIVGSHSPFFHPTDTLVRAVSIRGAVPQAYIDGVTAATACENAGKRLCTDTEWLRACQGAAGHTYPYGDAPEPGRCNDARAQHPAIEYFGTTDPWIYSELDHPCLAQLPAGLQVTGAYATCESDDGIVDMMGNLHEWTADPSGTFRGGFYVDTVINGSGCLYATTAHDAAHWDYSTGFRCCADPR